jgi:hypothetical protein
MWGEQEWSNYAIASTPLLPANETPVSQWDTWDFRGIFNQPLVATQQQEPNNLPLAYPVPWQFYPQ